MHLTDLLHSFVFEQVFVKSEFIGGSDILLSMHESGDLEAMLKPIRDQQRGG